MDSVLSIFARPEFALKRYAVLALFTLAAWAFGRRLTARIRYRSGLEATLLSTAIGIGALATGLMGLALVGLLRPVWIVLFLGATQIASWRVWRDELPKLTTWLGSRRPLSEALVVGQGCRDTITNRRDPTSERLFHGHAGDLIERRLLGELREQSAQRLQRGGMPLPGPGTDPYFSGGDSTWRHGSLADTELVSGIQIEHHYPGLRSTDANRRAYAALLAEAVRDFMLEHFGYFEP